MQSLWRSVQAKMIDCDLSEIVTQFEDDASGTLNDQHKQQCLKMEEEKTTTSSQVFVQI